MKPKCARVQEIKFLLKWIGKSIDYKKIIIKIAQKSKVETPLLDKDKHVQVILHDLDLSQVDVTTKIIFLLLNKVKKTIITLERKILKKYPMLKLQSQYLYWSDQPFLLACAS